MSVCAFLFYVFDLNELREYLKARLLYTRHTLFIAHALTHLAVLMPRMVFFLRDHLFCMKARDRFWDLTLERTASDTRHEVKEVRDIPSSPGSCSITKWISRGRFTFAHVMRATLELTPSGRKSATSCSQGSIKPGVSGRTLFSCNTHLEDQGRSCKCNRL